MSINTKQLREEIVRPILKHLNMHSEVAENLVLGTAAQESHMGTYIKQLGNGPAQGIFQMEPATHDDIWENYLKYKSEIKNLIKNLGADRMTGDLYYACAMCRVHYRRVSAPLPANTPEALGKYWKKYYNTELGKGTVEEFVKNYKKYVLDD